MTTPSQTVGPYLSIGLPWPDGSEVVPEGTAGRIRIYGRLLDGAGEVIPDGMIETWQADPDGKFGTDFRGIGRAPTDEEGAWEVFTVKPGAYPWRNHPNAWRPAHIHFSLFGRAFTQRLVTQMYFPDDPLFFQDPIYNSVRDERAARRMISAYDHDATEDHWALAFRWDIVLRGEEATPTEEPHA